MKQIPDTVFVGIMWFYAALYCSQTNSLVLQRLKLIKRSACFLLSLDRNCKYFYAIYSKFLNCMFVEPFQGECGCFGIDSWWFESPKQNNLENKSWLHFSPLFHCFMFEVQLCLRERLNLSAVGMSSMMPPRISRSPHRWTFGIIDSNNSQVPGERCSWSPWCIKVMFSIYIN